MRPALLHWPRRGQARIRTIYPYGGRGCCAAGRTGLLRGAADRAAARRGGRGCCAARRTGLLHGCLLASGRRAAGGTSGDGHTMEKA